VRECLACGEESVFTWEGMPTAEALAALFCEHCGPAPVKHPRKQKARTLLSQFSSSLGREVLKVRIYRDRRGVRLRARARERDGTSFTMVLPFKEPGAARALLAADPYYARVRGEVGRALIKLERALRDSHGKAAP